MSKLRVSGDVFLDPLSLLFKKQSSRSEFPFNAERIYYYYFGRTAIWHGLSALGLKTGDEVVAPIYNCGTEIDPLLKFGLSVRYYDQYKALQPDLNEIEGLINSKTRAIYITHFFGFPQPLSEIKSLCEKYKLFLIEDCAPALYSKNGETPLGSEGDISIFSFRKTLPLTDGSALVINNPELPEPETAKASPAVYNARDVLYFIKGHYIYDHNASGLLPIILKYVYEKRGDVGGGNSKSYETSEVLGEQITLTPYGGHYHPEKDNRKPMSTMAMRIMKASDQQMIVGRRRSNFEVMLNALKANSKIETVFTDLPDGVCPLNFPIVVDDRQSLREHFEKQDIALGRWWRFFHEACPWSEYPTALKLKNHLVSIPIHQDMNENILKQLAAKIVKFFESRD